MNSGSETNAEPDPFVLLEYKLWSGVKATVPSDKEMIEQRIIRDYPGGFSAFEFLMVQATLVGEIAVQDNATTETSAAIDETRRAAEKWLTRTNSNSPSAKT